MILKKNELLNIKGGEGVSIGLVASIGAFIAFLISAVEGYFNPKKCEI